jgi:hypothetical protein
MAMSRPKGEWDGDRLGMDIEAHMTQLGPTLWFEAVGSGTCMTGDRPFNGLSANWPEARTMSRTSACAFALLALCACGQDPIVDLLPSIAVVYGDVTTQGGVAVAGAFVTVHVRDPQQCDGPVDPNSDSNDGTATTDAGGHYRVRAKFLHYERIERCMAVRATSPAGSGLGEATVTGANVTFIHESLTPPVDSVRVDLVLPPQQ